MVVNFERFSQANPCAGCPAPCCQLQLIPHRTPATFMEIDFLHYMLMFPRTEVVVTINGDWSIVKWENCGEFEAAAHTCRLHNTAAKPRTCAMYNPYNCWYKKSFVGRNSQQLYRLNLARFEVWVNELQFAEDGKIMTAPDFERSLEVLKDMPIEPCLEPLGSEGLSPDPRLAAAKQEGKSPQENQGKKQPFK
jgi:hypothetical protein